MGAKSTTYTEHPAFGQNEVFGKYQAALKTLACRVLGEPYNFRQIDEMVTAEMCGGDYFGLAILEAQKQFRDNGRYSPQSIGLASGASVPDLLKWSQVDAEIDTAAAWEMFAHLYGQWVEMQNADTVRSLIANGSSSEEIAIAADKFRKDKGVNCRVIHNDGKADFERELIDAINCKSYKYPIRPNLKTLRDIIPFFEPGEYIVVAARTGMGKSFFALNSNYQAAADGVPSCYINLENTPKNVQRRLWQMHTGVKWQREYPGISQAQVGQMLEGWEWVKKSKVASYTPPRNLHSVLNTIRKDYYDRGCQLAVVDYLQKIKIPGFRGIRVEELAEISASLRELANDLKIPIMALAQISREAERSADKRPSISDIRSCGDIEQDASSIFLLYRPSYYEIKADETGAPYPEGYADIFIGKGRDCPQGLVSCRFNEVAGFYDTPYSSQFPVDDITSVRDYDAPF